MEAAGQEHVKDKTEGKALPRVRRTRGTAVPCARFRTMRPWVREVVRNPRRNDIPLLEPQRMTMRGGTAVPRYACQPWALRTAIIVPRMSFQV
jgi:hypothetical protein